MSDTFAAIVHSIVSADGTTSHNVLRIWLDEFYEKVTIYGLSSEELLGLVAFVMQSHVLSINTKLYIVQNCLLPREVVTEEIVLQVVQCLGSNNRATPFKPDVPNVLQTALVKWLVHVYFLVHSSSNVSTSLWVHLWQYSYLQKWTTPLIVWSVKSQRNIKRWYIDVIKAVVKRPGYQFAGVYATIILQHFKSIIGAARYISEALDTIASGKQVGRNLDDVFILDVSFMTNLMNVIAKSDSARFKIEILQNDVNTFMDLLRPTKSKTKSSDIYLSKIPYGSSPLTDIYQQHQLVDNWSNIMVPNSIGSILSKGDVNPIPLLYLSHLSDDKYNTQVFEWMCLQLDRCFNANSGLLSSTRADIIKQVFCLCSMNKVYYIDILQLYLRPAYLSKNPTSFNDICFLALPALSLSGFGLISQKIDDILEFINASDEPLIGNAFYNFSVSINYMIRKWVKTCVDPAEFGSLLKFIDEFHSKLASRFSYGMDNCHIKMQIVYLLQSKSILSRTEMAKSVLPQLVVKPSIMNTLFLSDDPLILNSLCRFLSLSSKALATLSTNSSYLQNHNKYITDLTNYLWRNKVNASRDTFGLPQDFIKTVIDSIYMPYHDSKFKSFFTITCIPAFAYTTYKFLRVLESRAEATVHYSALINEESFKKFLKSLNSHEEKWIGTIASYNDLKVEILKQYISSTNYKDVAVFLSSFLKSLSWQDLGLPSIE